jgi:UMF1 family MFS transporter
VQVRIGHVRAIVITLVGWIVMSLLVAWPPWRRCSEGRALAGALAPEQQRAEFYGFWTFAIRLSAIIGPLAYGHITLVSVGNHRLAIICTGLFFVLGLVLLRKVNVARGMAATGA